MNTQDLRKSAKEVGDAYRRRGTLIVKKAIELENVTGAEVHISIKPPKSSLKPFRYPQTATVDVPAEVPADDGAVASTSAEQGLLPPLQPQVLLSPACTTPKNASECSDQLYRTRAILYPQRTAARSAGLSMTRRKIEQCVRCGWSVVTQVRATGGCTASARGYGTRIVSGGGNS